jgi:hypothetical protein
MLFVHSFRVERSPKLSTNNILKELVSKKPGQSLQPPGFTKIKIPMKRKSSTYMFPNFASSNSANNARADIIILNDNYSSNRSV